MPNLGVRAEWGLHLSSDHEQSIPPYVLTSWVRFPLASASYPIPLTPLEQIPPVIFSEVMRDVDLFVSVSSAGTDPYGNNEPGEIGHYWHTYNQSVLSLSAMERKNVLERLVPRLTIAERCTFDGNFLIVPGNLCTYRIHPGSGNIQMKPDNRYSVSSLTHNSWPMKVNSSFPLKGTFSCRSFSLRHSCWRRINRSKIHLFSANAGRLSLRGEKRGKLNRPATLVLWYSSA